MTNKILSGVTNALDAEFGLEVFVDEIEQDLDPPCFLINSLTVTETSLLGNRRERSYPLVVQYFPKSTMQYRQECNDISERLLNCLELIQTDDGLIRGGDMGTRIDDGILSFEVTYKMHILKVMSDDSESMENLDANMGVKE